MSENKRKKKKKRRTNRSSKQKIEVISHKEDESKERRFPESPDRRSRLSDCYQMVVSRITNVFARRDRDVSHAETNSKVGCETERALAETGVPSTWNAGRLSREDLIEHRKLKEIPSRTDLLEAIEELCKPRLRAYIKIQIPTMKCYYYNVDHYVTSFLIEIFNNEPNFSKDNPMMSELLNRIINSGKFCGMNLQTTCTRKKQNRRSTHKKIDVPNEYDRTVSQAILHKTKFPELPSHPPNSLCRFLRTALGRTTNTSGKETDVSERPENLAESLPSPLRRQDQLNLTKDPLAGRIAARDAETKIILIPNKGEKGTKIVRPSLTGRIAVRENSSNTEIYVSPKRQLLTCNLINFSKGNSLENTAPVVVSRLDKRVDRNLQYAITKSTRMFSRISFAIGRERHTIIVNITATESFWRLMQRLLNSFQVRRPTIHRLEDTRGIDAIVQCRPNEQTTNITVDLPEIGRLTFMSVPVSLLELLLQTFSRHFTAIDAQNLDVGRYQILCCRYRSPSKRLHMKKENTQIYVENLRDILQSKYESSFWRCCPRVIDTHILWKNDAAAADNDTAAAKEEDFNITAEIHTLDIETPIETILADGSYNCNRTKTLDARSEDKHTNQRTKNYDVVANGLHTNLAERQDNGRETDGATYKDVYTSLSTLEYKGAASSKSFEEEYDAFCMPEPCSKHETDQRFHSEGAKARDYKNFADQVPDNLLHIMIPPIDMTEIVFEKDMDGNREILVSGGFGDICQAHLSSTEEEVIVKIVRNMTYEDVLRETRIQTYLTTSVCVPPLLGIVGGPEETETMIVQQMCAKGRTLYDLIEECLAETLVLFTKHWLELCYQLAINLETMHDKGILHNDIKSDNILVDLRPNDVRIYFIDFGQATFRSGGILHFDEGDDSEDYLAPEVCSGLKSSPESDIYSLGVIFCDIADEFCECLGQLADDMCKQEPVNRPTLEEIIEILEELIMEND